MLGYQYFIEQEAIDARKECADYYGLPKSPEDETIYWVNYEYSELNFWYIVFDESIEAILGKPTNFEI
tara:strand:- start:146 stop:349 length:204 start_codon:yes stop_codon:yes gene_type:complete